MVSLLFIVSRTLFLPNKSLATVGATFWGLCANMVLLMGNVLMEQKPFWNGSYALAVLHVFILSIIIFYKVGRVDFAIPEYFFWIALGLGTGLIILMMYSMVKKKVSTIWWEAMLMIVSYAGVWIVLVLLFPIWLVILIGALTTLIFFFWKNTYINNLFYLIGALGIGILSVRLFSAPVLLLLSAGVLLHERYRAKEFGMASLFYEAKMADLVPGILIPIQLKGWLGPIRKTWQPGKGLITGLLPFMAFAGLSFHLLVLASEAVFFLYCLFVILVGVYWADRDRHKIKSEIFLVVAVLAFLGIYLLFL